MGYGEGKPVGLFTASLAVDDVKAKVKIHVVTDESHEVSLTVEQKHVTIISRANELVIQNCEHEEPVIEKKLELVLFPAIIM